jgi:hypothetical protein
MIAAGRPPVAITQQSLTLEAFFKLTEKEPAIESEDRVVPLQGEHGFQVDMRESSQSLWL